MPFRTFSTHSSPNILEAWTKAALSTNQVDPFCSTSAWQLAFHDAFSPNRRLLFKESSGSVIAFAEKIFSPERIFITPIEPSWLFGCPLMGKESIDLFIEALAAFTKIYAPTYPTIVVSGIRPGGILSKRLLNTAGKSFDIYLNSSGIQCTASLAGGIDGYLSRRSANHRNKLRKAVKKAKDYGLSFERSAPRSAEEANATYARMLTVELTSWKGIGKCGMAEPVVKDFYAFMMQRLASLGDCRVIFSRHEGKDVGFIFGGLAGKIYRGQQFSYVDDWKSFSIGNLMQFEQITWLCEEGVKRYDMGPLNGPRMDYKVHWTEKEIPHQTWLFKKSA